MALNDPVSATKCPLGLVLVSLLDRVPVCVHLCCRDRLHLCESTLSGAVVTPTRHLQRLSHLTFHVTPHLVDHLVHLAEGWLLLKEWIVRKWISKVLQHSTSEVAEHLVCHLLMASHHLTEDVAMTTNQLVIAAVVVLVEAMIFISDRE